MNNTGSLEIEELKKLNKYTRENIEKLKNGYPIQYLIGYVDFYGLKIKVNENTLIPRYETEYLIEKLLKYIEKYNVNYPKILDMCAGTGCIGLTLKHELPESTVTLSDVSSQALEMTNQNKKDLNLDVEIIQSDLFENIKEKDYDILISNPPYVFDNEPLPKEVIYEPNLALFSGPKGINHIDKILMNAQNYLKEKFIIALEINEKSETEITNLINKYFDSSIKYSFENDLAGKLRYLFIFKNLY